MASPNVTAPSQLQTGRIWSNRHAQWLVVRGEALHSCGFEQRARDRPTGLRVVEQSPCAWDVSGAALCRVRSCVMVTTSHAESNHPGTPLRHCRPAVGATGSLTNS